MALAGSLDVDAITRLAPIEAAISLPSEEPLAPAAIASGRLIPLECLFLPEPPRIGAGSSVDVLGLDQVAGPDHVQPPERLDRWSDQPDPSGSPEVTPGPVDSGGVEKRVSSKVIAAARSSCRSLAWRID